MCVGTVTEFWKAEGFLYGVTNQMKGGKYIFIFALVLIFLPLDIRSRFIVSRSPILAVGHIALSDLLSKEWVMLK